MDAGLDADRLDASDAARADAAPSCTDATPASTLLIVFDESASMLEPFVDGGTETRLDLAREGVRAGVATLPEATQVGVLFFPTALCVAGGFPFPLGDGGVLVEPIDQAPQIGFRAPSAVVEAWDARLEPDGGAFSGVGSPLQEAFDRANDAVSDRVASASSTRIVLVTDGAGATCFPGGSMDGGVAPWPTELPKERARAWVEAGFSVHVIALPGMDTIESDAIADTTSTPTILPATAADLADALRAIAECR